MLITHAEKEKKIVFSFQFPSGQPHGGQGQPLEAEEDETATKKVGNDTKMQRGPFQWGCPSRSMEAGFSGLRSSSEDDASRFAWQPLGLW